LHTGGGSGGRGELGVAVDALCGPDLADAAVLVDGVAARLCDDGALGLRARVFAVLAAADYDDVEDRERRRASDVTRDLLAREPASRYLDALAAATRDVAALLGRLERELVATARRRRGHTDDANRSDTDDDDREAAPWSCDVRAMPRGAAELRCRVDDLLDSISTACDRREADWLGGSLRAAAVRAGVVDDACHDLGVERLRDYDALLAGPLRGAVVAEASAKVRASLDRVGVLRATRRPRGSVPRGVVEAVLRGEDAPRAAGVAEDPGAAARAVADGFVYAGLLRPALAAARAILAESAPPSKASRGFRFGRGPRAAPADALPGAPPAKFYDVVRAADVAARSWRAETAGAEDAAFRADLESTLADAAKQFAKALGAAFADARGEKDFAIRDEPDELRPTRATLLFRDELSGRADGVARALGGGDELLQRWRAALADEVFAVVEAHLAELRVSAAGAFVLGRDVDELRRAVSDLGSDRADAHFAALREGVAVFKLDPESLKYLVLQPDGPLAGLDRAAVVDVLSRRTDAWTYRGRRAAWVDELAASF